jgi:hypothetical protein
MEYGIIDYWLLGIGYWLLIGHWALLAATGHDWALLAVTLAISRSPCVLAFGF